MDDLQYEVLIDEARQPRHYGELTDAHVILQGTNASCGDTIKIFLQLEDPDDPKSRIINIKWVGEGCIISQATMSVVAHQIMTEKLTVVEAAALTPNELEKLVGLQHISTGRIKCLTLGVNTLKSHQS